MGLTIFLMKWAHINICHHIWGIRVNEQEICFAFALLYSPYWYTTIQYLMPWESIQVFLLNCMYFWQWIFANGSCNSYVTFVCCVLRLWLSCDVFTTWCAEYHVYLITYVASLSNTCITLRYYNEHISQSELYLPNNSINDVIIFDIIIVVLWHKMYGVKLKLHE